MAGVEVCLHHIQSGNVLLFEAQSELDATWGDYDFHDIFPLPILNVVTVVVASGGLTVKIPLTSGHTLEFECAEPGTVPDGKSAVTEVFGETVVGATPYQCAEFVVEKLWQKLGWTQ